MNDFIVIGAGISGASVAYELAAVGEVSLIEAEAQAGYHSTARSAALFTPNYGNGIVRRINALSEGFFRTPPQGFCDHPLLSPRGLLTVAGAGEEDGLKGLVASGHGDVHPLSVADALVQVPILRPESVAAATYEPGVMDIDVASLHQGYLRGFKARGGTLIAGAPVTHLRRDQALWHVVAGGSTNVAPIVVNAAGAWADQVGLLAGAAPLGLVPKRRTAIVVDGPAGVDVAAMPAVETVASEAYFKPEAGRIMASLGDETPTDPQDAQPEELDIALTVDWLMRHTTCAVGRVAHSWAGLRTFAADGAPVVGFDALVPGFFWLAGQGGYGIMMSPLLSHAASSLAQSGDWPGDVSRAGILPHHLAPTRFTKRA
ncbi:MAG: FAD-binding oxidoreductase [Devosia sp.]